MAEIIKVYKERIPAMRFIGKRYSEIGYWDEWFENGWFDAIKKAVGPVPWENSGGYIGLERHRDGEPFEYWLGMFAPPDTEASEDFLFLDFEEGNLGVCWIYGREDEVHLLTRRCRQRLESEGMEIKPDKHGAVWCFENCLCPRYTTPDENGNIVLDYCYFVK